MNKILFFLVFFFCNSSLSKYFFDYKGKETPKERAEKLVQKMTLNEKLNLVRGIPGKYAGTVQSNQRLNIPELHLGPQGVADGVEKATCFPSALTVVSSWDLNLMKIYSGALSEEQRIKGTNIMLGPMNNIARVPLGGRNFESFGEDPYLASQMTISSVNGIQEKGVMACAKHYVDNNQEYDRTLVSADVDSRTQHEIYYPHFVSAVKAGCGSFMCSYNKINNTYACENKETLSFLKDKMKYDGFVMSDWGGCHSTVNSANNGLDLEMPGSQYFGSALEQAIKDGKVSEAKITEKAIRILTPMYSVGIMDTPQTGDLSVDARSDAHTAIARLCAEESMVLLKNQDNSLPLTKSSLKGVKQIAIIGDDGDITPTVTGRGSGHVIASYVSSPFDSISREIKKINSSIEVKYHRTHPYDLAAKLAGESDLVIVFMGIDSGEGHDRVTLSLGVAQETLLSRILSKNQNTMVVVNAPGAVTMPFLNDVKAALLAWLPGQEDGNAVARILTGQVVPSGKLPITFPLDDKQTPFTNSTSYPGVNYREKYSEGVFVGYRFYDKYNLNPLFPFGYGLSYTTFKYENLEISGSPLSKGGAIKISVKITNSGRYSGKEVVQLYLGFPTKANNPPKVLKRFYKTDLLNPGESVIVNFEKIEMNEDVSVWDSVIDDWKPVDGKFSVFVGSSSRDIRLEGSFTLSL